MAAPLPPFALAQDKVLPLRAPCLDHLDVVVPDFEATTKFFMDLFNTELHAQELRGRREAVASDQLQRVP
jgi:hypothetical protein